MATFIYLTSLGGVRFLINGDAVSHIWPRTTGSVVYLVGDNSNPDYDTSIEVRETVEQIIVSIRNAAEPISQDGVAQ